MASLTVPDFYSQISILISQSVFLFLQFPTHLCLTFYSLNKTSLTVPVTIPKFLSGYIICICFMLRTLFHLLPDYKWIYLHSSTADIQSSTIVDAVFLPLCISVSFIKSLPDIYRFVDLYQDLHLNFIDQYVCFHTSTM